MFSFKIKKLIIALSVLIMAITSLFFTACFFDNENTKSQESTNESHVHSYQKISEKEATCVFSGEILYQCDCGDFYKETIEALGHDLIHREAQDNTCQVGWDEYDECSRCSYSTRKIIPAIHTYVYYPNKQATCYEEGWNEYSECIKCGFSNKKTIPITHGKLIRHGEVLPTCTEDGCSAYDTCEICGYELNKVVFPAKGHSIVEVEGKEPTCTEDGYRDYEYCKMCNYTTYEKIECGHLIQSVLGKNPTCTESGYRAYEFCLRCDYTTYEEIKALGHNITLYGGKAPTCINSGYITYEACSRCEYTTYQYLPETGHNLTFHKGEDATYESDGYEDYYSCDKCSYTTYKIIPKLAHSFVYYTGKPATCTEKGYKDYAVCTKCGYSTYEEINAFGHNLIQYPFKEATCVTAGNNSYKECTRCSYTTKTVINALGHDIIHHIGKEATCTEDGYEEYDCCSRSGCSYTTYKAIPAFGHVFSSGTGIKTCIICGKEEAVLTILKNGTTSYRLIYDSSNSTISTAVGFINKELKKTVGWQFSTYSAMPKYNSSSKYISIGNNGYSTSAGLEYRSVQGTDYQIAVKGNSIFVMGDDYAMNLGVYGLLNVLIGYEKYSAYYNGVGEEIVFNSSKNIELGVSQIERTDIKDIAYTIAITQGNLYSNAKGASLQGNSSMGYTYMAQITSGNSQNDDGITSSLRYNVRSGHNSLAFFPKPVYQSIHPEWYAHESYKDGSNSYWSDPAQLCYYSLWNDQEALDVAFNVVKHHTSWNTIFISNMDTNGDCECKYCKGNLGYQYIKFLNALSDMMAKDNETKHMTLGGMIYKNNSMEPPLDGDGNARITTNSNVIIEFAFDQADYYAGFSERDNELLEKWSKVSQKFRFWTYCQKSSYGMFFFDDFTNMQKLFETMYKYGAISIQHEGYEGSSTHTNFNNLRVYLVRELSKNTGYNMTDDEAKAYYERLTDKFFNQYFDIASEEMRAVFEFQKTKAQYMYNNWIDGINIFQNSYYNSNGTYRFKNTQSQITPTNEFGNNNLGTYSSWGYHLLAGNKMYGNRYAWSMVYSKNDFLTLFTYFEEAINRIESSNLSSSRKETIKARVELEKIGIMYQFMFIYENAFAKGNSSMNSTLTTSEIKAMGYDTLNEAMLDFIDLCTKFGISSADYNAVSDLATIWGIN